MSDPKLVISQTSWDNMSPEQQAKITYDTVISMREDVINLSKKVDAIINKPVECPMESRVKTLEKWKVSKMIVTALGSIAGGFGGSHIPK